MLKWKLVLLAALLSSSSGLFVLVAGGAPEETKISRLGETLKHLRSLRKNIMKWKLAVATLLASSNTFLVGAEETKICRRGEPPKPLRNIKFYDSDGARIHNYELHGQARIIEPAPDGIARALRIDGKFSYALLKGVDISSGNMKDCTLAIGVYIESIRGGTNPNGERAYGWVMSHDNGGFDRAIFLHDERFNGMGMSPGYKFPSNEKYIEPPLKEWIQIVAVWRQGGECFMYINSKKKPFSRKIIGKNKNGLPDLAVGAPQLRKYQHENDNDVWIKEVKVWDRALNDTEVEELNCQFEEEKEPTVDCGNGGRALLYSCTDCTDGTTASGCAGDCMWDASVGSCVGDHGNDVDCGDHDAPTCEGCKADKANPSGCAGECNWFGSIDKCKNNDFSPVDCGDHEADTCATCPEKGGSAGCAGECKWDPLSSGCVKDDNDDHVDCGDHHADICENCDASINDLAGCRGECQWNHSTATCRSTPPVICGDHEADTCAECPIDGGSIGCAGECKWDPLSSGCIKDDNNDHVDCGDHHADTCKNCDASINDLAGCSGQCKWDHSTNSCGPIPPVDCGDHEADTCAACPVKGGSAGCAGECKWDPLSSSCIKDDNDDHVDCGDHRADTCDSCDGRDDLAGCRGECQWDHNIESCGPIPPLVDCGDHKADSCAKCPLGFGAIGCAGECKWDISTNSCTSGGDDDTKCGKHNAESCSECPSGNGKEECQTPQEPYQFYGVGKDNLLYFRNSHDSPWLGPAPFGNQKIKAVRAMNDGSLLAVGVDNYLYKRTNLKTSTSWVQVPNSHGITALSARRSDNRILGTSVSGGLIWYLNTLDGKSSWVEIPNSGAIDDLDVDSAGWIIVCDKYGVWYRAGTLEESGWSKIAGSAKDLMNLAVMRDELYLGVRKNNRLYTSTDYGATWTEVNPSYHKDMIYVDYNSNYKPSKDIIEECIKPDPSLCSGNCLWDTISGSCGPVDCGGFEAASCSACVVESAIAGGFNEPYQFYGVGEDNLLYFRNSHDSPWLGPAPLGNQKIKAVRIMKDSSLVAVGIDHYLYKRANLNSDWVQVPNSHGITALSVRRSDNRVLGASLSNDLIWYLDTLDGESSWVEIPKSGTIDDLDVDPCGWIIVCDELGVWYRSSSLSESGWRKIANSARDLINITVIHDKLYLGVRKNKRLYTSSDYGATWSEVNRSYHKNMIYVEYNSNYETGAKAKPDPSLCGGECKFDFDMDVCVHD